MHARPRHIAAAGVAGGLLSASLFLGHAALTPPKQPAAPAAETKPAPHTDMLSGRSVTPTRFVTNGAPAPAVQLPPRKLSPCGKRKKRER